MVLAVKAVLDNQRVEVVEVYVASVYEGLGLVAVLSKGLCQRWYILRFLRKLYHPDRREAGVGVHYGQEPFA